MEEKVAMEEQYERQARKLRLKPKTVYKNGKDLKIRFLRANETFGVKGDVLIDFSGFELGL